MHSSYTEFRYNKYTELPALLRICLRFIKFNTFTTCSISHPTSEVLPSHTDRLFYLLFGKYMFDPLSNFIFISGPMVYIPYTIPQNNTAKHTYIHDIYTYSYDEIRDTIRPVLYEIIPYLNQASWRPEKILKISFWSRVFQ